MKPGPDLPRPADPGAFAARLYALLEQLVLRGGCSTEPAELAAKGDLVAAEMEARGLAVSRVPGQFAPHLVGRWPGGAAGCEATATLLVGHYDTVHPPNPTGYAVQRQGEYAVGPTVADMSGGLVVLLGALDLLREGGHELREPLAVLVTSDEERGSPTGAGFLAEYAGAARRALVFEGGRDRDALVLGRKGKAALELTVYGREAHAGIDPEAGVNAIAEAGALIEPLKAAAARHGATLVVGGITRVEPGVANTVPGKVVMSGDLRYLEPGVLEPMVADMRARLGDTPARLQGHELEPNRLEQIGGRPAWSPSPADLALWERFAELAGRLAIPLSRTRAGGGSDANNLAALGVPVIDGLGPVGARFHRLDESIRIDTLLERTLLTAAYLATCA